MTESTTFMAAARGGGGGGNGLKMGCACNENAIIDTSVAGNESSVRGAAVV
jgi:hypothetical protein